MSNPVIPEHPKWKDIPPELRDEIGLFLLKPSVKQPQDFPHEHITEQQKIDHVLSNRKNMDIAYPDRNLEDSFKYTKMPFQKMYGHCSEEQGYFDPLYGNDNDPIRVPGVSILGDCMGGAITNDCCYVATVPCIAVVSMFGLFGDCGRAVKRKYDNANDEALHREIIGPTSQVMK